MQKWQKLPKAQVSYGNRERPKAQHAAWNDYSYLVSEKLFAITKIPKVQEATRDDVRYLEPVELNEIEKIPDE